MMKTTAEIAKYIGGELIGDGSLQIRGVNAIEEAKEGDISFVLGEKYAPLIKTTKASCVIVPPKITSADKTLIKTANPSVAFSKVVNLLLPDRIPHPKGIHPTAVIEPKASLGKNVAVGPYVVIRDGASIGDGTVIYPFSYVGNNARIGKDCLIYPGVTIREDVTIGSRVIIHPGAVIGSDGFGYDVETGMPFKIPQIGTVVIEDDVEIGSNTTIDRARFARTVICMGTKIDNLVQIAHNVIIGRCCILAAQVGISGSCKVGDGVVMGGQVGVADHLEVASGIRVGAQSGISKSFKEKGVTLWGTPAKTVDIARRLHASTGLLPKLYERVRGLEKKVKELESKKASYNGDSGD